MEAKKAKELIQRQIDTIASLREKPRWSNEYKSWQYTTDRILEQIFGENSKQLKRFEKIRRNVVAATSATDWNKVYSDDLDESEAILSSFIQEIETFGIQPPGRLSTSSLDQLYDSMNFHPRIKLVTESLFKSKHYSQAIFEAFKEVCNLVKKKSGKRELDGQSLMAEVFNEDHAIIRLNPLKTKSDKDEQTGFRFLFMGAMTGIRNPKAHDFVEQKDPYKTLEYLGLASLLAKKVDEGKKVSQ